MKLLTNISNFTEYPLYVANAVNESAGVGGDGYLGDIISKNEPKILKEVLGNEQFAILQTELTKGPFSPGSSEQALPEYVELVNGSSDYSWQGLRAMLDNYIFCAHLRATEVKQNFAGAGKGKTKGFTIADNSSLFAQSWNLFVENLCDLGEYLETSDDLDRPSTFPNYETENSLGL